MSSSVNRKVTQYIINAICRTFPPLGACRVQAVILPWLIPNRRGSAIRFSRQDGCLVAHDGTDSINFYSPYRAARYIWPEGVGHIKQRMLAKYLPDAEGAKFEATVIDIGANVGEFSVAVAEKASRVYAFDPDPLASMCLRNNATRYSNLSVCDEALGECSGTQPYYLSARLADSSLIRPTEQYREVQVKVTTLDEFVRMNGIDRISLIKLEAEGAEPEIIRGAAETLAITEAITVDVSPEREGCSTLPEVRALLEERGFQLVRVTGESLYATRKMG